MFLGLIFAMIACAADDSTTQERRDAVTRTTFKELTELQLRAELINVGKLQIMNVQAPHWHEQKAMIAEALTKWDAKNGTNNWDRAAVHFEEAIAAWEIIAENKKHKRTEEAPHRIGRLHLYAGAARANEKKWKEAKAHYEAAGKVDALKKEAEEALKVLKEKQEKK